MQLFDTVYKDDLIGFSSDNRIDYRKVSSFMQFSKSDVSKLAGIAQSSIRYDKQIPKELAARLEEIANIANRVANIFDDDVQKTALWFRTPNPMLGNVSPKDMLRMGRYKRLAKFVAEAEQS